MTKIAALVPMRHQSQRVPGKNYRSLAGKPLFHHIIETLLEVSETIKGRDIELEIVVNTDSAPVMADLRKDFDIVRVIERPERLRANDLPMNEILAYDTSKIEADFYLQTHSTNPLLRAGTVIRAIDTFLSQYPTYDSLFSVTRLQTRLWDPLGRAINHNPAILLQTQDLPPVYEDNSCLYIFTRKTLGERRIRIGERPLMYEIDAAEAWDIDEELDFEIVNLLMQKRLAN